MSIHNMEFYKRQTRAHWLAKLIAWVGVVLLGSFLMFCAGLYVMRNGAGTALLCLAVMAVVAWGIWGFVFLKTRH